MSGTIERQMCPVPRCGRMIIADRKHMSGHIHHSHGELPPRERALLIDSTGLLTQGIDIERFRTG